MSSKTIDQQTLVGMLNSDFVVEFWCIDCDHDAEYETGPEFKDAGGALLLADPCIVRCPGCGQACWSTLELPSNENRVRFNTTDNIVHEDTDVPSAIVAACHPCRAITTVGEYDKGGLELYDASMLLDGIATSCDGCGALRRIEDGYSTGEDAMFMSLFESATLDCPECEMTRSLEPERGPAEPELGWEYYRCTDCDAAVHRESVE